jgi:hypothetical protein
MFLTDVPNGLIDIVSRMVNYDVNVRNKIKGLSSERIGTYSYTMGSKGSDLNYPDDVTAGLDTYKNEAIGGVSVFVN